MLLASNLESRNSKLESRISNLGSQNLKLESQISNLKSQASQKHWKLVRPMFFSILNLFVVSKNTKLSKSNAGNKRNQMEWYEIK